MERMGKDAERWAVFQMVGHLEEIPKMRRDEWLENLM